MAGYDGKQIKDLGIILREIFKKIGLPMEILGRFSLTGGWLIWYIW
jgi:hypothetical protein